MKSNLLKTLIVAGPALALAACASTGEVNTGATGPAVDARPSGPVPGSQADLEQTAGHRVFFGYDQYNLTAQAQATLARQASWLKQYPEVKVRVAGNCDERGTREYNLALGARRANAAKDYLVSLGVDPSRVTTISYGKERPIDPRSTAEAWALNRNSTSVLVGAGS